MNQLGIILLARDQIERSMQRTFRYEEESRRRVPRRRGRTIRAFVAGRWLRRDRPARAASAAPACEVR